MKSVQLNGILVCRSDVGREIVRLVSNCANTGHKYTIQSLGEAVVYCEDGYVLGNDDGPFEWESPPSWVTPPKTTTPNPESPCPRQRAANALREAYAKCEELGLDVCSYGEGSLSITYQPEEVVY